MLCDNINRNITRNVGNAPWDSRWSNDRTRRPMGFRTFPAFRLGSPTQPVADQSLKRWVAPKCSALGARCANGERRAPGGSKMDGREMTIKSYKNTFIWDLSGIYIDLYGIYLGFLWDLYWFIWDLSGCRIFSEGELYGSEKFPRHGGSLATPNTQTG